MLLKYLGFSSSKSKNTSSSRKHSLTVIEELCHQFSLADLRKSTNNFDKKLIVGKGVSSTVYKGCLKHNGATIALKRMEKKFNSKFKNETELLCQLRHPNLVSLMGFCNHKEEKIIVYEYLPNGSLHDHLYRSDMEPLSWKKRVEICIGVARGVHYLHTGTKRTIFHRDIKPSNILLDNNMAPKLSGFGISLQGQLFTAKPKPIIVEKIAGTLGYMAPEYALRGTVNDKCDVYSLGMLLLVTICSTKDKQTILNKINNQHIGKSESQYLENLIGNPMQPWSIEFLLQRLPVEEIIDPILRGKIAPECWEVFMDITPTCLKYDPNERPTMGEVEVQLEHALSLQEEADLRKTNGDYTLLSTTIINMQPPICMEELHHQFSLEDLSITTRNFDEMGIIGRGSFATVYKGLLILNGATEYSIAIKWMDWSCIGDSGIQWNFKNEIEYLCHIRHPNLVSLLGFCDDEAEKILVYEYMSNGSLHDQLRLRDMEPLSWKKRLEICIGAAQGLHHLHIGTIFHGNLKLSNILLDKNMVPKLSGFGLPWSNPRPIEAIDVADAEGYVAPEWFLSNNFTDRCDIHSFGIVLLQVAFAKDKENIFREFICSGSRMPAVEHVRQFVRSYPAEEILDPVLKGKIAPECWEVFLDITEQCFKFEPNERPTMNQVKMQLEHALALQEEADANTGDDCSLLSATIINQPVEMELT